MVHYVALLGNEPAPAYIGLGSNPPAGKHLVQLPTCSGSCQ